jgi:hypothetical protein
MIPILFSLSLTKEAAHPIYSQKLTCRTLYNKAQKLKTPAPPAPVEEERREAARRVNHAIENGGRAAGDEALMKFICERVNGNEQ